MLRFVISPYHERCPSVSLAARNLIIADKAAKDLLVPCAACFQRLKAAEKALKSGKPVEGIPEKFTGNFNILHPADFIWDQFGEKGLANKVKKSLADLNPVCYYGCLITRPPKITDAKNPEDPQFLDDIVRALGANVKNWSYKTDCCGGNLILTHTELAKKLIKKLFDMALEAEADCIVVGCPMCQSNLDTRQKEVSQDNGKPYNLPIYYFSELMGLAFGEQSVYKWLNKHLTDAKTLLKHKGLI